MKKGIIILALSGATLITSCSSRGWSCKGRYVKAEESKEIRKTKDA